MINRSRARLFCFAMVIEICKKPYVIVIKLPHPQKMYFNRITISAAPHPPPSSQFAPHARNPSDICGRLDTLYHCWYDGFGVIQWIEGSFEEIKEVASAAKFMQTMILRPPRSWCGQLLMHSKEVIRRP